MADLAKYDEIQTIKSSHSDAVDNTVNQLLSGGWEIVTAKVVEVQYKVEHSWSDRHKQDYIKKDSEVVVLLGKPRQKKGYPKDDLHQS